MFLTWRLNKKRKSQNGNKIKKLKKIDYISLKDEWTKKLTRKRRKDY